MTMPMFALERNIFASGLKSSATTDENKVEIEYILNAPAIALEVQFINAEGDVAASVAIADADLMTAGAHKAVIDLAEVPGGSYKWAVKAQGAPNPAPDGEEDDPILEQVNAKDDTTYIFYNPQGVVVDNSYESDHFGWLYVSDSMDGDTDGMTNTSKTQKRGLFIYDQMMQFVYDQKNEGFLGGVNFRNGRQGMRRLETDAEGYVYMCDNNVVDPVSTGVWRMDPANPTEAFTEVLAVSKRDQIYTRACSAVPAGSGNELVLYLLDNMSRIARYPIGQGMPYAEEPDSVIFADLGSFNLVNGESTMRADTKGGFWIFQYRGQLDGYPMMAHASRSGEVDWLMQLGMNDDIAPATAYRGAGAVSIDGKYVALGGNKSVNLYEVTYKGSGDVKSITKVSDYFFPSLGTNIDGIAFDVANNIYVISASTEYMHVFAVPTVENTFVTPAPSKYMIESKSASGLEDIVAGKSLKKGVYTVTGQYLGETADNLPKGMYIINGEKVVK